MEHRHDREHRVLLGDREVVRLEHAHRVNELGAMGVHDALRIAGGAGRVAHGRCHPLAELGPRIVIALGGQQGLVVEQLAQSVVGSGRGSVGHEHNRLDAWDLSGQRLQERNQRLVYEKDLVLGVIDDEFQVLWKQAQVEGVQDGAHAGHCVIQLEVPVVVPGQRGHPISRLDAEPLERAGQAVDAADHLPVGDAVEPLLPLRDHLLLRVQPLQAPEHMLYRELVVLHQAFHGLTSSKSGQVVTSLRIGW